ncbi:MAG TPA: adenylate/guanylate cyclase domain-containing protein [Acidimicrobiales bacterium]|nr:adenylate/guanylate cyclase domain-containing protein [Acidimicrobiales bacterium]
MTELERDEKLGPFETMTWHQAVRLIGGMFIFSGVVTSIYIVARPAEPGYRPAGVVLTAVVGVLTGAVMLILGERFNRRLFYPLGPAAILIVTMGQYFAGQWFLGTVFYVWIAIFSFYLHPRRHAIANLVLIGVAEAWLLAVVDGNESPVAVWVFLMSTVAVTAGSVSWLIERVNRLAALERKARRQGEAASEEIAQLNRTLETRVQTQVDELERLGRLRRFLAPQVADALLNSGEEAALAPHRREIAVLFCDLRGFTAFSSSAEPEEVLEVLDEFYAAVGDAVHAYEATIGTFAGDGVMAYFNDPVPCSDPAPRAVEMALSLRGRVQELNKRWQILGHDLGLGMGIALGFASLGVVGFEDRREYTPLGRVVNLASRLCDEALAGQILLDRRAALATRECVESESVGDLMLKGFRDLVPVYRIGDVAPRSVGS